MSLPGVCVAETRVSTHTHTHTLETRIFEYRRLPANTRDETRRRSRPSPTMRFKCNKQTECGSAASAAPAAATAAAQAAVGGDVQNQQKRRRWQRQRTRASIGATATSSRCASAYTLTHTHTHLFVQQPPISKAKESERALVSHTYSLQLRADCSRAQAFTLSLFLSRAVKDGEYTRVCGEFCRQTLLTRSNSLALF